MPKTWLAFFFCELTWNLKVVQLFYTTCKWKIIDPPPKNFDRHLWSATKLMYILPKCKKKNTWLYFPSTIHLMIFSFCLDTTLLFKSALNVFSYPESKEYNKVIFNFLLENQLRKNPIKSFQNWTKIMIRLTLIS